MAFESRSAADIQASLSVALQPTACGRHLVRHLAPDEPFFYLADTAWQLFHNCSYEEAEMYLRNRAAKGFNSVCIVILAEHGALERPNREGHRPFLHDQTATEDYVPDMYRPNPAYFSFIDRVLALAASIGITISLVPTWGRYVCGGYHQKPILFDNEDKAFSYGRFLGSRYPFHPFLLGGDSPTHFTSAMMDPTVDKRTMEVHDYTHIWDAMGRGLVEGEREALQQLDRVEGVQEYDTMITYHSSQCWFKGSPEATASAQFLNAKWLKWDGCQSGHYNGAAPKLGEEDDGLSDRMDIWSGSASYVPIRKMYSTLGPDGRPRPVVELEGHYEATHHWFDWSKPLWTEHDIRNGAWQGVFSGACGYTYGCNSIWQMHNNTSTTHPPILIPTKAYTNCWLELDLAGSFYVSILRRFFLSLPDYFSRRPDTSFILSDLNESQDGKTGLDRLVQGLRADTWALVHLPYGGEVTIDLRKALEGQSSYRAWWVSPRTGAKAPFDRGAKQPVKGIKSLRSPSSGSLETDWVLLLESYTA